MSSPGDLQQPPTPIPFLEAESRPLPFLFLTCCVLWPKVHSLAFHASKINPFRNHTLPSYPRFASWEHSFPHHPIRLEMLGFRFTKMLTLWLLSEERSDFASCLLLTNSRSAIHPTRTALGRAALRGAIGTFTDFARHFSFSFISTFPEI